MNSKNEENIQKLVRELQEMEKENLLKDKKINEALNEKEGIKTCLMALEREHSELTEMYDNRFSTNIETKSLSEELDLADSCSLNTNFKCNVCDKNFSNLNCLNGHQEENKDEVATFLYSIRKAVRY